MTPTYEELIETLETMTNALAARGQIAKGDAPLLAYARERITAGWHVVDATRGNPHFKPARCLIASGLSEPVA
jgi:hypothetical protein